MLCDLAVTRSEERCTGADDPSGGLHGGSWQTGTTGGEGDPCERTDKHTDDVDSAENAMDSQVTLSKSRGELERAGQKGGDTAERVWNQESAVCDDLNAVAVIHRIVRDQKYFRSNEDKQRRESKEDPESGFESEATEAGRELRGSCHYSPSIGMAVMMRNARASGVDSQPACAVATN
jgi:hypothetical protein